MVEIGVDASPRIYLYAGARCVIQCNTSLRRFERTRSLYIRFSLELKTYIGYCATVGEVALPQCQLQNNMKVRPLVYIIITLAFTVRKSRIYYDF